MGGLGIFREIAWSAPLGPWGASAVSGGESDAKRALCPCVALASQWRLLIGRPKRPLFSPVSGAHHHMLGLPESNGDPVPIDFLLGVRKLSGGEVPHQRS